MERDEIATDMSAEKARADLAFIRKMMDDSKRIVVDSGLHFLSWGLLSIAGSIASLILGHFGLGSAIVWVWIGIYLTGAVLTFLILAKTVKGRPKTLAGRLLARVWGGIAIVGGLGFVALFAGNLGLSPSLATVAALLGLAVFISSLVLEHKIFSYLGYVWWVGAIVIALLPGFWAVIVFDVFILFCHLIPGWIVYRRWSRSGAAQEQ